MGSFFSNLVSTNLYKGSQGRVARRSTFIGLALVFLLGAFCLYRDQTFGASSNIAAIVIAIVGMWCSFRTINYPTFADFLVSVEAEMAKVSWPTKKELFANTKVVLLFMFLFTVLIFIYDIIFRVIFGIFG